MVKARTYKLSSSVKVEQLEAELSLQLQALRTEIENNETHGLFTKSYSSVHIPKDVSYFRTERQQVLQKGLKVAGVKPVVSQAGVIQKELESCLGQEYTPESLPLLLHQFFTDRTYQLAQFKYQLMLRWKRFCRHSIILEQLYPQYKDHMTHLTKEFEDAKHRAHRLAVSRERVLTGTGNPINVVMPEDVVIYLQWLICHLHSVKTIHCFLHVLHYLPMCERREEDKSSFPNFSSPAEFSGMFGSPLKVPLHAVKLDGFRAQLKHLLSHYKIQYNTESIKTSADHFELFSMVKNEFKAIFQSQNVMSTFLQYESTEAVDTKWGRRSPNMALRKECNWIPHIRVKPKRDPWQQKQMFRLKEMRCVDEFLQMHSRSCEVSDLLRVGEILMQHAAFVCEPKSMESLSVTSKPTAMSDSLNIWRSIYNIPHLSQAWDCLNSR
ncbi:putative uncharacterized protein C6orf183 [Astyanax mexicanus]|uniref:putative uncharacterized protein C6orf183 n=1 Tax=Astyanax mexicanus TaxID=7994 RepID=UPI0020CAE3E3|nr:putative uncharacterized protein C6orf183 [Astyanax mexicanus]